jgi:hypothetical protein
VSPVKYELGFYIPKDDILHSYCLLHFHDKYNQIIGRETRVWNYKKINVSGVVLDRVFRENILGGWR